ncbi:MAG: cyclic nucleotide-binding domain-containing protein [Myxococcales bacterium]|nr:cyclic nucleotide-binding domain-containing protein [Myxococcales bacterium]
MGMGPDDRRPPNEAGDDDATRSRAGVPIVLLSRPVSTPNPLPPISEARMVDALGRIPLFDGLTPPQLARLARIASERLYGSGEAIFRIGDPSEGLFIVLEGTVKITREIADVGDETLAVLRTGQHFGEMSLIDDAATRSANASAHHRVRALLLPRRDLRDLMFVDRELANELLWRFVRLLTRRVREANDRLAMLSASSRF